MSNGNTNGFVRRAAATVLGFLAVVTVVLALVVRTVHNELFTTDRYVQSVTALAGTTQLQEDVAKAITDGIVDNAGLDSPDTVRTLRRVGIDAAKFKERMHGIVEKSVLAYVGSDGFRSLWADTNRTTHERFVALLESPGTPGPLTVDLGELARSAAGSVADSSGYIGRVIPLAQLAAGAGDVSFELMSADTVESARTAASLTSVLRWALLAVAAALLVSMWLVLGRRPSSLRIVGGVIVLAGLVTFLIQRAGAGITVSLAGDVDEQTVRAVYGVATDPLVGYSVVVAVVGAVILAAASAVPVLRRPKGDANMSPV